MNSTTIGPSPSKTSVENVLLVTVRIPSLETRLRVFVCGTSSVSLIIGHPDQMDVSYPVRDPCCRTALYKVSRPRFRYELHFDCVREPSMRGAQLFRAPRLGCISLPR